MKSFEELGISPELIQAIRELGFENPMPVQEEVIPYLLTHKQDVVALAQTGTGKTAAFGLPIIQQTELKLRKPQTLVLSPTRELCLQIADDLTDYSKYTKGFRVLPVYGGSSIEQQIRTLKEGVQVVVATPGRLIDLIHRGAVKLENVHTLVLDEADEMLNMGFSESIDEILKSVPEERTTLLFSATMPNEIARIAKQYMHDAKEIVIGNRNESTENVKHTYYLVQAKDKYLALKRLVDYYPQIYGMVFCRTRKETQEVADALIKDGYNADALHGELSQQQRDYVMQKFRLRNVQLLVATDIAARGLDVSDLTHVINYGLPDELEVYTHRSGRTGRAGKVGQSIAIIHLREKHKIKRIEQQIKKEFQRGVIPSSQQITEKQLFNFVDRLEKVNVNEEEIASLLPSVCRRLDWLSKEELLKHIVSLEFNRFIEYYKDAEEISVVEEKGKEEKKGRKGKEERGKLSRKAEKGFTRLFINLGKRDNLYPNILIELINRNVGNYVKIGKIDLLENFSFFEVASKDAGDVIEGLTGAKFSKRTIDVQEAEKAPKRSSKKTHATSTHDALEPKERRQKGKQRYDWKSLINEYNQGERPFQKKKGK